METFAELLAVSAKPGCSSPVSSVPPHAFTEPGAVSFPLSGGMVWAAPARHYRRDEGDRRGPFGSGCYAAALSLNPRDFRDGAVTASDLGSRVTTGTNLAGLEPPCAAVTADGTALTVAADPVGLRHVYGLQRPGWAAISTSAMLLAGLAGGELDRSALGTYRLIGHHLGTATPYRGVVKLPAGQRWQLVRGAITTEDTCSDEPAADLSVSAAVEYTASLLRETMVRYLDEYPDVVLELSGGLDSRLLLAAIRPKRRKGLRTLTLSSLVSRDREVAGNTAVTHGLQEHVVDLDQLANLLPEEAYALVHGAAHRHDAVGDPVSLAVLDWVEAQAPTGSRIGGQGGEYTRGYFYPGQCQHDEVNASLVDRLARWRIFANNTVDLESLDADFVAATEIDTLEQLRSIFQSYDKDWLSACDEFYLQERLQRWVGINATGGCLRRTM